MKQKEAWVNIMQGITDYLAETGENEFEIMEFTIKGECFGIEVPAVKEIMKVCPIKPVQRAQKSIEGIFQSRDRVITVVDLADCLDLPSSDCPERDIYIIFRHEERDFAFHVHTVVGIHRLSSTQLQQTDRAVYGAERRIATSIVNLDDRLITLLDFDAIIRELDATEPQQEEISE